MFSNTRHDADHHQVQTSSKTTISIHFPNLNNHIRETLECIFDQSGKFGDILLKVGPDLREFRCHRTILSFSSSFLCKLLLSEASWKEPVIILPEFDPEIIEYVLMYIYTGELNVSPSAINGFLEVCTLLEIKGVYDQQYKLLNLVETTNDDDDEERLEQQQLEKNDKEETKYTIVNQTNDDLIDKSLEETDFVGGEDVSMASGDNEDEDDDPDDDSIMEEEYVLEEVSSLSENTQVEEVPVPSKAPLVKIIASKTLITNDKTSSSPPLKKVRLKQEALPKTKQILRLQKLNFAFNEIEGTIGSWKHARLLTDGTANINAANAQYIKERLEVCTAKIYENVVTDEPFTEKYKVRMYFCADPVRLKAMVECLICQKAIQVSYKHKNGKFKQWINSNVLRHVETIHKTQKSRSSEETRKKPFDVFTLI